MSGEDEEVFDGWAAAMNEVVENEYSERAERMVSIDGPLSQTMGAPPAIIESATVDSGFILGLESLEDNSEKGNQDEPSADNKKDNSGGETTSSWLDLAASSSSKGSQGSYADQVPALAGSGSALEPFDVTAFEKERGAATLVPNDAHISLVSPSEQISQYESPRNEIMPGSTAQSPIHVVEESGHTKDSMGVDEILGAKGEPIDTMDSSGLDEVLGPKTVEEAGISSHTKDSMGVDDILGPQKIIELPSPDSIDEVLSPRTENNAGLLVEEMPMEERIDQTSEAEAKLKSSESDPLIDLSSVKNVSQAQTASDDDDEPGNAAVMGRIVQSLGDHHRAQTRPENRRLLIGPKDSALSHDSTFSNDTSHSGGLDSRNPLSPASETHAQYDSVDNTFSVEDNTTFSRGSTLSPKRNTFSPTSFTQAIWSSDDSRTDADMDSAPTYSYGDGTVSRLDSADPSFLSGHSEFTGRTEGRSMEDYSVNDVHTETDASMTGHTRRSEVASPGSTTSGAESTRTGFFTAIERTAASKLAALTHQHEHTTPAHKKTRKGGNTYTEDYQRMEQENKRQPEKKRSQFAESLMAKTRSRAEPSALLGVPSVDVSEYSSKPTMINVEAEVNERYIRNTAYARKRVGVVQLLMAGLLGILACFFGSLGIISSCHFVSADVKVGETDQVYNLHYGIWKYTPIGSAFQGYTYCDSYDKEFTSAPPYISQGASIVALLAGSFANFVLWWYLISGQATRSSWYNAVRGAILSAMMHGTSLLIFVSPVCKDKECKLGPGGAMSLAASAASFILAFEMYYNSPITSWRDDVPECPSQEEPSRVIQSLEMAHIQESAMAYCKRLIPSRSKEFPTLNQIQRKNEDPIGDGLVGRDLSKGVYAPPSIV